MNNIKKISNVAILRNNHTHQKVKARKRRERTQKIRSRWRETLKQEMGYNERSWDYQFFGNKISEWFIDNAQRFNTRTSCSCSMCGNPRRHFGHLTSQELRFRDSMKHQINEFLYFNSI